MSYHILYHSRTLTKCIANQGYSCQSVHTQGQQCYLSADALWRSVQSTPPHLLHVAAAHALSGSFYLWALQLLHNAHAQTCTRHRGECCAQRPHRRAVRAAAAPGGPRTAGSGPARTRRPAYGDTPRPAAGVCRSCPWAGPPPPADRSACPADTCDIKGFS